MGKLITIRLFSDNLCYLYTYETGKSFVVDPGQSEPVLDKATHMNAQITDILLTHDHGDHTGGVAGLRQKHPSRIHGSSPAITGHNDNMATDGRIVTLGNASIVVISTPGHTETSVCWYLKPRPGEPGIVFTGDTLFVGGCGRVFGGDMAQMWQSLQKLAALPDDTIVCGGHDYTVENFRFACAIEPGNKASAARLAAAVDAEKNGRVLSSTIGQERRTNIFLRADEPAVKQALGKSRATAAETFSVLRGRKDLY